MDFQVQPLCRIESVTNLKLTLLLQLLHRALLHHALHHHAPLRLRDDHGYAPGDRIRPYSLIPTSQKIHVRRHKSRQLRLPELPTGCWAKHRKLPHRRAHHRDPHRDPHRHGLLQPLPVLEKQQIRHNLGFHTHLRCGKSHQHGSQNCLRHRQFDRQQSAD